MRDVYLVDGRRTPFIKAEAEPGPFSATSLAVNCAAPLLLKHNLAADIFDEVIVGCVMPQADEANIARKIALLLGCGDAMPAFTVQRNCASGMQAVDSAVRHIALGESDLILAGGTEAMSHAPVLYNSTMVTWLGRLQRARKVSEKLKLISQLRPKHFKPVIGLLKGLTDPVVNLNMGQTAEIIAHRFNISREQMDAFALQSHNRLANALDENLFDEEVVSVFDGQGHTYAEDNGLRRDSSLERLAKLRPIFDRPYGKVTAGNSSQITDGSSMLIVASESALKKHKLEPIAKLSFAAWGALKPSEMGLGPVHASAILLNRHQLTLADIDYWEINEAFAGQVLACLEAMKNQDYAQQMLGQEEALGEVTPEQLNIHGGAISVGHPVGASGARIIHHAALVLKQQQQRYAIATLCIGGGQGGAMLIENIGVK